MSRLCLLVAALMLGACASAPLPPLPAWQSPEGRSEARLGQIVDLASGQMLTPDQLVDRLTGVPQVLVGEKHDNPDHHALQLWLLQALESRRAQGSLVLEMLVPAQQARVDALPRPLPQDLAGALGWQEGWDWTFYGPIVRHALQQGYPVLAANLDKPEIGQIYRQRPELSGSHSTAPTVTEALLRQVRDGHCGMLPESQLPAMLAVQQQRDRRIAERLMQAPEPALLLAGSFHARKDIGVPLHLQDLGDKRGAKVLLLVEAGETVKAGEADYVWYTAALLEQDYCAQFRKP